MGVDIDKAVLVKSDHTQVDVTEAAAANLAADAVFVAHAEILQWC